MFVLWVEHKKKVGKGKDQNKKKNEQKKIYYHSLTKCFVEIYLYLSHKTATTTVTITNKNIKLNEMKWKKSEINANEWNASKTISIRIL